MVAEQVEVLVPLFSCDKFRPDFVYAPAIYNGGGGAYSITLVHTYIHTSRTYEKWFPGDIF